MVHDQKINSQPYKKKHKIFNSDFRDHRRLNLVIHFAFRPRSTVSLFPFPLLLLTITIVTLTDFPVCMCVCVCVCVCVCMCACVCVRVCVAHSPVDSIRGTVQQLLLFDWRVFPCSHALDKNWLDKYVYIHLTHCHTPLHRAIAARQVSPVSNGSLFPLLMTCLASPISTIAHHEKHHFSP